MRYDVRKFVGFVLHRFISMGFIFMFAFPFRKGKDLIFTPSFLRNWPCFVDYTLVQAKFLRHSFVFKYFRSPAKWKIPIITPLLLQESARSYWPKYLK